MPSLTSQSLAAPAFSFEKRVQNKRFIFVYPNLFEIKFSELFRKLPYPLDNILKRCFNTSFLRSLRSALPLKSGCKRTDFFWDFLILSKRKVV
ncbi:hypothetical protein DMA11_22655 [Marinilabiliaceae bacterium JC017]|nr:hypothetical protein DMA11_22655 [Marinilabiliaceae bacterium JC017]